jgi:AraC family transcriptional regulator
MADDSPGNRVLAKGVHWTLREYHCTSGPADRPFEESHEAFTIAAVAEGTFNYHGAQGRAALYPGTLLLGNAGACYCCGHDHSHGDRCLALSVAPVYFSEIAASHAGSSRFKFPMAMLPARNELLPLFMWFQLCGSSRDQLALDERVAIGVATLVTAATASSQRDIRVSGQDARRIRAVVHHISTHASDHIDLDGLSAVAATSKYHLLRIFRRVMGMTPYQFVLQVRLRQAALRIAQTTDPVANIAFDAGFGDLSTFNARFRKAFGTHPTAYRRNH